jgi:hypothetical protein
MRVQQSAVLTAFLWHLSFFTSNASEQDAPMANIRRAVQATTLPDETPPNETEKKVKKAPKKKKKAKAKKADGRGLGESM